MSFTLGMVGPAAIHELVEFVHRGAHENEIPRGLGGSPVTLLVKELLRRGRRVSLFTLDPSVAEEVQLSGDQLRIFVGPYRPKRARDFFAVERAYLARAILREQPDVLHAQWTYEFALGAIASGLPHVVTAHDAPINVMRLNFIPYRIARTVMAYAALWRAGRVVAVSPYVQAHLRRYLFHFKPITVVPNGMPQALFGRQVSKAPEDRPPVFATVLVGWAGRKNGQVAIEAFSRVRERLPGSRLLMFGAGHGPGEPAEQWSNARRLGSGVEFIGQLPYPALLDRLVAEVDVLVHPALEEAQPMALIEAMAIGIPVIGGRKAGGVPWTLDFGRAGMLVDVNSPAEVARAMLSLADSSERGRVGSAGRSLALRRNHISAVADAYEEIYAQLMQQSSSLRTRSI